MFIFGGSRLFFFLRLNRVRWFVHHPLLVCPHSSLGVVVDVTSMAVFQMEGRARGKKGWGSLVEAGPSLFVFVFVSINAMCPWSCGPRCGPRCVESLVGRGDVIRDADGAWRTSLKSSGCVSACARHSLGGWERVNRVNRESRESREVSLERFFQLEKTRILPHPLWLRPAPALLCDSCNGSTRDACWTPVGWP